STKWWLSPAFLDLVAARFANGDRAWDSSAFVMGNSPLRGPSSCPVSCFRQHCGFRSHFPLGSPTSSRSQQRRVQSKHFLFSITSGRSPIIRFIFAWLFARAALYFQ